MGQRGLCSAFVFGFAGLATALAEPVRAEEAAAVAPLSGSYEVSGRTIDQATGAGRDIEGTISLKQTGDRYTSNFELKTVLPGTDAAPAQVIGTGEGRVEGNVLRGTAHTQLLTSSAGVDVGFVGMPRQVSARILSTSVAELKPDGSIRIEIENEPAEGEASYSPTRTLLSGKRFEPGKRR